MKKSFLFAISTLVLLSFSSLCYSGGSMKPFGLYGGGGGGGPGATEVGTAAGEMLFWDVAGSTWAHTEISELFFDDAAKRLGIGTASPDAPLTILSEGANGDIVTLKDSTGTENRFRLRVDVENASIALLDGLENTKIHLRTLGVSYFVGGNVGINTLSPDRKLEVLDTAGPQLRLTYTDGSVFADLEADSNGDFIVTTAAQKTLVLAEPVWKDINIGSAFLSLPVATRPGEAELVDNVGGSTGIYTLGWADGEKASGVFEMQHDYKEGTDVYFHVHWQGNDAPSGTDNVKWQLTWTMAEDGQTLDPVTVIVVETAIDTQYEAYRSDFAAITGTNFDIGDQFLFLLERITAAGDVYLGDAVTFTIGAHYQVDTMGSRQAGVK